MSTSGIHINKLLVAALTLALALPAFARGAHGAGSHSGGGRSGAHAGASYHPSKSATGTGAKSSREHVSGYTSKDGTHVAAHNRSTKDSTKANN
jgi:hypothetical protein